MERVSSEPQAIASQFWDITQRLTSDAGMQRAANGVATDADVREVAYGLAVARGGDSAYEAMFSLYLAVCPATARHGWVSPDLPSAGCTPSRPAGCSKLPSGCLRS